MMHIKRIEISEEGAAERGVLITLESGEALVMSFAHAGIIKQQLLLEELRCGIRTIIDDEISGGYIDAEKYEAMREDFDNEIYEELADDIECGDYTALCNDGEWIRERVGDLAAGYGLEPDEDDEDDE